MTRPGHCQSIENSSSSDKRIDKKKRPAIAGRSLYQTIYLLIIEDESTFLIGPPEGVGQGVRLLRLIATIMTDHEWRIGGGHSQLAGCLIDGHFTEIVDRG